MKTNSTIPLLENTTGSDTMTFEKDWNTMRYEIWFYKRQFRSKEFNWIIMTYVCWYLFFRKDVMTRDANVIILLMSIRVAGLTTFMTIWNGQCIKTLDGLLMVRTWHTCNTFTYHIKINISFSVFHNWNFHYMLRWTKSKSSIKSKIHSQMASKNI